MKETHICSRRQFLAGTLAAAASGIAFDALAAAEGKLYFVVSDKEFTFDTGALRGTLHGGGKARGLLPAFDCQTGTALAKSVGLFSHYRLLDDHARYGTAGWDWASQAVLSGDGAVQVNWMADAAHPLDMQAVYRWSAANTLDLTTRVTARKELRRLEVFLASYFDGFSATAVYAKDPSAGDAPAFIAAAKEAGVWHMFPRDDDAVKIIQDGRWKFPPNPVDWVIRPKLAAPLAIRRDADRKLAAVLMTRAEDCFAVACPHDDEGHRSVYFSLFGRDLKDGESAEARSRLIIGRDIPDAKALELYETFRKQEKKS